MADSLAKMMAKKKAAWRAVRSAECWAECSAASKDSWTAAYSAVCLVVWLVARSVELKELSSAVRSAACSAFRLAVCSAARRDEC